MQPAPVQTIADLKVQPEPEKLPKPRRTYDLLTEQLIAMTGATTRRQRRELSRQVVAAQQKAGRELARARVLIARDECPSREDRRRDRADA